MGVRAARHGFGHPAAAATETPAESSEFGRIATIAMEKRRSEQRIVGAESFRLVGVDVSGAVPREVRRRATPLLQEFGSGRGGGTRGRVKAGATVLSPRSNWMIKLTRTVAK